MAELSKTVSFKQKLNQVFDDNLHTKIWHNILDWVIIGLILVSSLEVFLSTFSGLTENYGGILKFIDVFTTVVFTIEVTLRIWAADALSPEYAGFKGRVRYCLSFYGLIDILSTYPALIGLFTAVPVTALKIFRVVRLIRIFRYMRSFRILGKAVVSKKQELVISFTFLSILTVILSFLLYYAEHEAQPELCENGWSTLVWAFAKYLGDPGKIADFPLVTVWGNIIAAIVGVLGIAIFAVPAGLIGSGFIEVIDETRANEKVEADIERLHHSFRWEKDMQYTNLFHVPAYKPLPTLLVKQYLQENEVIEAVKASGEFHLYNLSKAYNNEDAPADCVVVVNCLHNRPYGCCIDRGSKVTIVSTSGHDEPITSWVAYHLAKIGGFNYVAKEEELDLDNPVSFYTITDPHQNEHLEMFLEDIEKLSSQPDSWVMPMAFCIGPKTRKHKVHLCFNKRNDFTCEGPLNTVANAGVFETFSKEFSEILESKYSMPVDKNEYYGISKDNLLHRISCKNGFALRMECYVIYFAADKMAKIKDMANIINKYLEPGVEKSQPADMLTRPLDCYGYRGYKE